MGTTTATRVDQLTVHHPDDSVTVHPDAHYYVHRGGVDVVDPAGGYVARHHRDDVVYYTADKKASPRRTS